MAVDGEGARMFGPSRVTLFFLLPRPNTIRLRRPAFLLITHALAVPLFDCFVYFEGTELMAPIGNADATWSDVAAPDRSCFTYTPTPSTYAGRDTVFEGLCVYNHFFIAYGHFTFCMSRQIVDRGLSTPPQFASNKTAVALDDRLPLAQLILQYLDSVLTVHSCSVVSCVPVSAQERFIAYPSSPRVWVTAMLHDGHFSDCLTLLPYAHPCVPGWLSTWTGYKFTTLDILYRLLCAQLLGSHTCASSNRSAATCDREQTGCLLSSLRVLE